MDITALDEDIITFDELRAHHLAWDSEAEHEAITPAQRAAGLLWLRKRVTLATTKDTI